LSLETEDYPTRKAMKKGKILRHADGWSSLHTDIINTGFHVTYDKEDPNRQPTEEEIREKLRKLLVKTIENDTITFEDLKMLMRLERGLELEQTTIDKLIVVRQGGFSGIIQRIKNLFNL